MNRQDVFRTGWEHGYTGFPSSSNPYQESQWQHEVWRAAHFEGMCVAIDEGELAPI